MDKNKLVAHLNSNEHALETMEKFREYKEKCERLEKENKRIKSENEEMKWFLQMEYVELKQLKQDALLGKALRWASETKLYFVDSIDGLQYNCIEEYDIEKLLEEYQNHLEKGE